MDIVGVSPIVEISRKFGYMAPVPGIEVPVSWSIFAVPGTTSRLSRSLSNIPLNAFAPESVNSSIRAGVGVAF